MEGFNGQYLFVIPEHDLVVVKFTKYSHNRDNGYVISFGPLDYLLWLPFSWLKAIGEAFAGEEEETSTESDDGGINMPATMSQKINSIVQILQLISVHQFKEFKI